MIDISNEIETRVAHRERILFFLAFLSLTLSALALSLSTSVRSNRWDLIPSDWAHFAFLPIWLGSVYIIHRSIRRSHPFRDPFLLPIGYFLTGWGILAIWRLSPPYGVRQSIWFILASAILYLIIRSPGDLSWLRRYRYALIGLGLGLVILTLLFGANPSGAGPRLWLGCCGVYFQPSELLRLILVAFLASYLAERFNTSYQWTKANWWVSLLPLLVLWAVSVVLLFIQRDLGTGILFLALLVCLIYVATGRWQVLATGFVLGMIGAGIGLLVIDIAQARTQAWLFPWQDPSGGSYQIVQSIIAIASGGLLGRGPGLGSPGFVPAAHTDFIFSTIAEEWGLVGGIALIALFAVLFSRGIRAALKNQDPFKVLLAAGISIALGLQAILIIGGVIRFLPIAGVTLPFVSYGGSSLLTSYLGLGLLIILSASKQNSERFSKPLQQIHAFLLMIWVALALVLGWWSVLRSADLLLRTDNPRRYVDSQYAPRGTIYDRNGIPLVVSTGEPGEMERKYLYPSTAQITGYDSFRFGQSGLEQTMDSTLRGAAPDQWIQDGLSRVMRGYPLPGEDIRLTLDIALQELAVEALGETTGSMVLMDTESGEVLVLASTPVYDPNALDTNWTEILADPDASLLHRAIQANYQPGGILAPFLFSTALDSGLVNPDSTSLALEAPVRIGEHEINCVRPAGLSERKDLWGAITRGCPHASLYLAELLDRDDFSHTLEAFGLTERVELFEPNGISTSDTSVLISEDLPVEVLGQGRYTVSPLQIARAFAGLVNPGGVPIPRLLDAVRVSEDEWQNITISDSRDLGYESDTYQLLKNRWAIDGPVLSVSTEALTGPEGELIGWYVVNTLQADPGWVLVVAAEGSDAQAAREIGEQFLFSADFLVLP